MDNSISKAAAAECSVVAASWLPVFEQVTGMIAGRFARVLSWLTARDFLLGLLSASERKMCWQLAEWAGHLLPSRMQRRTLPRSGPAGPHIRPATQQALRCGQRPPHRLLSCPQYSMIRRWPFPRIPAAQKRTVTAVLRGPLALPKATTSGKILRGTPWGIT